MALDLALYETEHPVCRAVMAAVAQGVGADPSPACAMAWQPKPAVVYGILRGCSDIIRMCHQTGIDWWHVDLGYFKRGHFDGYYKLSRNGLVLNTAQYDYSPGMAQTRWRQLGIDIKPWQKPGDHILICPPTWNFATNHPIEKLDEKEWVEAVRIAINRYTNIRTLVRVKPDGQSPIVWRDVYCVVAHSSNILNDALIEGVPAIALGNHPVRDDGNTIRNINDYKELCSVDRTALLEMQSEAQFTLDEFRLGFAFEHAMRTQGNGR
ncbi:MAG TPA: hypothetical protein VLS45_00660 [Methylomicrobium sp.]|nr:hypothetical protein [Methylomicrobium sp.]